MRLLFQDLESREECALDHPVWMGQQERTLSWITFAHCHIFSDDK